MLGKREEMIVEEVPAQQHRTPHKPIFGPFGFPCQQWFALPLIKLPTRQTILTLSLSLSVFRCARRPILSYGCTLPIFTQQKAKGPKIAVAAAAFRFRLKKQARIITNCTFFGISSFKAERALGGTEWCVIGVALRCVMRGRAHVIRVAREGANCGASAAR